MKGLKRILLMILMVTTIASQCIVTYGASAPSTHQVPSEVVNAKLPTWLNGSSSYIAVPVRYKGEEKSAITIKLKKTVNGIDISGYATFYIKAYAYRTNTSENIKVGAQVIYQNLAGKWVEDDQRDRIEQFNTLIEAQSKIGWPECKDYYITLLDTVTFVSPDANATETRVNMTLEGKQGGSFFRETQDNVKLSPINPSEGGTAKELHAKIATLIESNKIADDSLKLENPITSKTYINPIVVNARAKAEVTIKGVNISAKQYQFIESDTEPTSLPTSGWLTLDDTPLDPLERKLQYPDVMWDKQGYISTKHYNYKYGDKTSTDTIPLREETFKYPVGGNLVLQKATTDGVDTKYYSTAKKADSAGAQDAVAFYRRSFINLNKESTSMSSSERNSYTKEEPGKFDGFFVPERTGNYQFAIYSNIGSWVHMTINGKMVEVVKGGGTSSTAYYNSQRQNVYLEAGKQYSIHMETRHRGSSDVTPSLHYRIEENNNSSNNSNWDLVPSYLFKNERYVHGGDKAVKFWGYIIPTESGNYQLGAYSDDGAYGYIVSEGKKIEFVDDWTNAEAFNRSNGVTITLKKDEIYPIYMEWYEGKPIEKAFIPTCKKIGDSNFTDIPQQWFYPSANEEPGKVNTAYFDVPHEKTSTIPLPAKAGKYYLALQVTNQDDLGKDVETVRQVVYGPFEVKEIKPSITSIQPTKNYVNPQGLSSVVYAFEFKEHSKAIKCIIDLSELINEELYSKKLIEADFNEGRLKNMFVINKVSPTTTTLNQNTSDGYDVSVTGNTIMVTFGANFVAEKGEEFELSFYLPTQLKNDIPYNKYQQEYIEGNRQVKISATVTATPRLVEGIGFDEDGSIKEDVWGGEASDKKDIDLKYIPAPKIK